MTEIHRTDITRELPCRLDDHELLELAISKANAEALLEQQEAKLEDLKQEWSKEIKAIEKRIATMGAELRAREQRRPVACFERWRGTSHLEVVREDTGEVIDVRAATLRDAQGDLPGTDGEATPAPETVQTGFPEDDDQVDDEPTEKPKRTRKKKS